MSNTFVRASLHVAVLGTELECDSQDPEVVLSKLKEHFEYAEAIQAGLLGRLGGYDWELADEKGEPTPAQELAVVMARGYAQGKQMALEGILDSLADRHEDGCGCRCCIVVRAVLDVHVEGLPSEEVSDGALAAIGDPT